MVYGASTTHIQVDLRYFPTSKHELFIPTTKSVLFNLYAPIEDMVFASYSPTEATLSASFELPTSESPQNLPVSCDWHFQATPQEARLLPCDTASHCCQLLPSGWHLPLHRTFPLTHTQASASMLIISLASYIFLHLINFPSHIIS